MAGKRKKGPWIFVGSVAGISIASLYTLNVAAKRFPKSFLAKLNSGIAQGSSS